MTADPPSDQLTTSEAGRLLAPAGYSTPAEYVNILERKGLLRPIPGTESDTRKYGKSSKRYSAADVERLRVYLRTHRRKIGRVYMILPGKGP
jgi:hypothetical protein